jgi:hypothetical protein
MISSLQEKKLSRIFGPVCRIQDNELHRFYKNNPGNVRVHSEITVSRAFKQGCLSEASQNEFWKEVLEEESLLERGTCEMAKCGLQLPNHSMPKKAAKAARHSNDWRKKMGGHGQEMV